jgi:predicted Zn-dependent peptidase
VNLWYDVGSRDELPGQLGWAHLFEHLMFSGSAHVASGEHLHLLQSLGGSVNATTWFDRTNYFETIGLGALDLALWLEGDRLATLADHLEESSVETQREVVKEEKRQRYDNVPYGQAMAELADLVFGPDHPYGHTTIGSMADIDAATAQSAAAFFRTHYRPDNAVITLVGDVNPKDALKRVDRWLGWIPAAPRPPRTPVAGLPPMAGIPRRVMPEQVPAAATYLAWRLPPRDTPEFDACDLALGILGSGQTARLHQRIVRELELAASAGAQALGLIGGNSLGLAHVRALPGKGVTEATGATLAELERMADGGPTGEELDRAKAQYAREWLTELARFDSRADALSAYATLHAEPERINRRLAEVEAVDADAVRSAAATYLTPNSRAQLDYTDGIADATA